VLQVGKTLMETGRRMAKLLIAEILEKRKMSKRQFAKKLDKDYPTVFRYFRDGYDPKLSTLEAWAKVLNCRVKDLIQE
jgi:transcriptional regulator with XRE-family HTH domain